jgi:hypothetical protein
VAHHIDLAQLWKSFELFAQETGGKKVLDFHFLHIPSGQRISLSSLSPLLKDQKFILEKPGISYFPHHNTTTPM